MDAQGPRKPKCSVKVSYQKLLNPKHGETVSKKLKVAQKATISKAADKPGEGQSMIEKETTLSLSRPDTPVTFIIGKNPVQETFTVHKSFAISHSPFFEAAFKSKFVEGETQTMKMDDVEGKVFGLLVHWLYFQKIDDSAYNPVFADMIMPLAKLWVLADRCLIPKLQDQVISRMARLTDNVTLDIKRVEELATYAYDSESAPLKAFAIDVMTLKVSSALFREFCSNLPTSILLDLTTKLKDKVGCSTAPLPISPYTIGDLPILH